LIKNSIKALLSQQGLFIAFASGSPYRNSQPALQKQRPRLLAAGVNGWITKEQLQKLAEPLLKTDYGRYLGRSRRSEEKTGKTRNTSGVDQTEKYMNKLRAGRHDKSIAK